MVQSPPRTRTTLANRSRRVGEGRRRSPRRGTTQRERMSEPAVLVAGQVIPLSEAERRRLKAEAEAARDPAVPQPETPEAAPEPEAEPEAAPEPEAEPEPAPEPEENKDGGGRKSKRRKSKRRKSTRRKSTRRKTKKRKSKRRNSRRRRR